ncbi:MAG: Lpg1974 family pore-forming outer membrane protein [Chlamydiota bacterium]
MDLRNIFRAIPKVVSVISIIFMKHLSSDDGLANPSIRPKAQPKTIDMSIEALYWYTTEEIDWAFTLHHDQSSTQTSYKSFVFNSAPGFRVGLGYNMEHDQWDTQLNYTWFQSKASASSNGPITPGFSAARLSLLEPFSKGKANINLHYNMFDWDLGRTYLISKHLLVRPSLGIKAGWINQIIHSHWELFNFIGPYSLFATENLKQYFKAGGPKGGLTTKWCFGNTQKQFFSLIGAFEAGYLWGHWSIQDRYVDTLHTVIDTKTTPRSFGSFMLHSFIGLGWDCNFDHDRSHFEFKLGYEIEDWFNQCQIFSDISGAQNNDLILQGLRASLRFDF